ncbi:MAG TPA: type I-U CRISPR-associated protein Csx17 [Nitrospira sp.]|nr:type I-U CRISPR-associated protein Csx17 [Nitrospira sp.]
MPDLQLAGCRPEPLAHYLKALGILRLVSEQADPEVRGWWVDDEFRLRTKLSREKLEKFFLEDYRPTPVVAPWNGGSGFYPNDRKDAIEAIFSTRAGRFLDYQATVKQSKEIIQLLALKDKPDVDAKPRLLRACRGRFSEKSLAWVDAAYVLTDEEAKFPPLLGTGGNDGRLEFTNNFMQRLMELFDPLTGHPEVLSKTWLSSALWSEPVTGLLTDRPIGQFFPGAAGGANATVGFSSRSLINPWDFVLMIEGAVLFGSAATRRLQGSGGSEVGYPFVTRAAGVGYPSASGSDETPRGEMWMPIWTAPVRISEVAALFSEGKAQVGRRTAKTGVDFSQAIAALGTDRGVQSFCRYGFQVRNGLAYFATPLSRWRVVSRPEANLLFEFDHWLVRFRREATGNTSPARMGQVLRAIERAIMEYCQTGHPSRMANLLIALGAAEEALARSPQFRGKHFLKPLPLLSPKWLDAANDSSVEFRLAASLASVGLRENMEPVRVEAAWAGWLDTDTPPRIVWGHGSLTDNLIAVLFRRCMDAQREQRKGLPLAGRYTTSLNDIHEFIAGNVDERRLEGLLRGLTLINWRLVRESTQATDEHESLLPGLYALLKLTHLPNPFRGNSIPYMPAILVRAAAGDASQASRQAIRRLRGCGFIPAVEAISEPANVTRRIAGAVLFPISKPQEASLAEVILRTQ